MIKKPLLVQNFCGNIIEKILVKSFIKLLVIAYLSISAPRSCPIIGIYWSSLDSDELYDRRWWVKDFVEIKAVAVCLS